MAYFMGLEMFQTYDDLQIWERVFRTYDIRSVMELGTGYGGLTTFFALQCYQRNMKFITYDNVRSLKMDSGLAALLNIESNFRNINIVGDEEHWEVLKWIDEADRPLAIMVDNGDKPRDFRMVAPHTKPGDIIAVHDWETEFHASDIGDIPVEYIFKDLCDKRPNTDWRTIWLRRI